MIGLQVIIGTYTVCEIANVFSVISGIGEVDVNRTEPIKPPPPPTPQMDLPYLLLDLRDPDEYEQSHIITGSY